MAGAGYKAFADGDVLTAAQVQTYLQDQAVMKFADSSARSAALGTAIVSEGMVTYLADTDAVEVYDGSAWTAVGAEPRVLQTAGTAVTAATTQSVAAESHADITNLSLTFTPQSASSYLIIHFSLGLASLLNGTGTGWAFLSLHDGTNYVTVGDAAGSRAQVSLAFSDYTPGALTGLAAPSFTTRIASGSTSARTYSVRIYNPGGSSLTFYLNRSGNDSDAAAYPRTASTITITEVTV